MACPSCGTENPEGQRFCGGCGAPLTSSDRSTPMERKVITALFCDLVGFTATAEGADPEDVDQMLSGYAAMARTQIESHGGVVEKFIGDAIVGIFGVPASHEDDPERAVRAGLRIVERAEDLESLGGAPLRLRVGINTGETVVRHGVVPGSGERVLAGDAINVAARLQSVAPEMGVVVGLATYETTAEIFDYEEGDPATLKGKAQPVRVFHAKAPRARLGTDITRTHDTPFVGREIDLSLLKGIFDKAVASNAVQLATVVGEPGIGKSRIVAELMAYADAKADLVTWRQGRCLPYGEGITFWALGEIVKAHAGILESDPPSVAAGKLDRILPEGEERAWFRQRLLPLLGIEANSSAERDEMFTAWRRFLEHIAERDPTVLVFEDLHWADDAMLAFLEHLSDRAEGVPLLVLGTARPELNERHPDFGTGLRNVNTIRLAPLSADETTRLILALLGTEEIPAPLHGPILERAGGNPLYAEEFVRLLRDKDLLVRHASGWELKPGAEVPLPDSVHSLIAARLDTLGAEAKSMLADAAVVGKVFWAGAVAAMGGYAVTDVTEALRELSRHELVGPVRRSSMAGEAEYAFRHILSRDVAYAQLPRASRASRHVAAARWIESKASERVEDLADVLAYHYATALDLAGATGDGEQAADLEAPTLRFLTLAGERALGLDTAGAMASLERALALTPPGHPERPAVLTRFGQAAMDGGRTTEAAEAFEEAIASFRGSDDPLAVVGAMFPLAQVYFSLGDPRSFEIGEEALEVLEPLPAGPELVGALVEVARARALGGDSAEGISVADRAIRMADDLGLPIPARALGYRGLARSERGDGDGVEDMRRGLAIAIKQGSGHEAANLYNNLSRTLWSHEGPQAALEVGRQGLRFNQARGLTALALWIEGGSLDVLVDLGRFDEVLASVDRLVESIEEVGVIPPLITVRAAQARVLAIRGEPGPTASFLDWLERSCRETDAPEILAQGLGSSALARAALAQADRATALLTELAGIRASVHKGPFFAWLPSFVRAALSMGDPVLAQRLTEDLEPRFPYAQHAVVSVGAALAESRGELEPAAVGYADAAERWSAFGVVPEQAFALLGQGRCLAGLDRPTQAALALGRAREIFERLSATPSLAATDALLSAMRVEG